jgi:hypothetical protein
MLQPRRRPTPSRPARGKGSPKSATPLDRKQQALRDKEDQLRRQQEELERLIHEAPKMKEEKTRRRREALAADPRLSRTALIDKRRYDVAITADRALGTRRLRSEKRDGQFLFLFLCLVLASLVIWIAKLIWS